MPDVSTRTHRRNSGAKILQRAREERQELKAMAAKRGFATARVAQSRPGRNPMFLARSFYLFRSPAALRLVNSVSVERWALSRA